VHMPETCAYSESFLFQTGPAPLVSCAIELPDLKITGYALSCVGREHERRSQVGCSWAAHDISC